MPSNFPYIPFAATPLNSNSDRAKSSLPGLERLLSKNVRVLVYNGVNDAFLGVQGTRQALFKMNYERSEAFRDANLKTFGWLEPGLSNFLIRGNYLSDSPQSGKALLTHANIFGAGHFANALKIEATRLLVLQWMSTNTVQTPSLDTVS